MSKSKKHDFLDNAPINKLLTKAPKDAKFDNITQSIIKEQSKKLIDEETKRRNEDWSDLAHQIVGSETL